MGEKMDLTLQIDNTVSELWQHTLNPHSLSSLPRVLLINIKDINYKFKCSFYGCGM